MIYGSTTNGGFGPGAFDELVTRYARQRIEQLILRYHQQVDPSKNEYWQRNREIDQRGRRKVRSDQRAACYHWSKGHGRCAVTCPSSGPEKWRYLHRPNFDELGIR